MPAEPALLHVIRRNGRRKRVVGRITGGENHVATVETKNYGSFQCPEDAMFLDSTSRLFPGLLKPSWVVKEGHVAAISLNGHAEDGMPASEFDAALKSRIIEEALRASVMNKMWELAVYIAAGAAIGALCIAGLTMAEVASLKGIVSQLARDESARAAAASAARAVVPTLPPFPGAGP